MHFIRVGKSEHRCESSHNLKAENPWDSSAQDLRAVFFQKALSVEILKVCEVHTYFRYAEGELKGISPRLSACCLALL